MCAAARRRLTAGGWSTAANAYHRAAVLRGLASLRLLAEPAAALDDRGFGRQLLAGAGLARLLGMGLER
jgi:hypothetical protein